MTTIAIRGQLNETPILVSFADGTLVEDDHGKAEWTPEPGGDS